MRDGHAHKNATLALDSVAPMSETGKADQEFSHAEVQRRATAALRRALTTPYKPQRELVGTKKRVDLRTKGAKGPPKSPE